jgi:hypothetical protein
MCRRCSIASSAIDWNSGAAAGMVPGAVPGVSLHLGLAFSEMSGQALSRCGVLGQWRRGETAAGGLP